MKEETTTTTQTKSAEYIELEQKKLEIENQLGELEKVLKQEGNVGLIGPLVDSEGYPRADIDLYKVRLARQQINCLRNDYKQVMNQIEIELGKIYSKTRETTNEKGNNGDNGETAATANNGSLSSSSVSRGGRPFCLVTQVDPGSPAFEAGIQVGDEIVQFGPYVHGTVAKSLAHIGELVKTSVNKIILLNVARAVDKSSSSATSSTSTTSQEKQYVKIKLVPKTWSGHGLLGCKIVPMD